MPLCLICIELDECILFVTGTPQFAATNFFNKFFLRSFPANVFLLSTSKSLTILKANSFHLGYVFKKITLSVFFDFHITSIAYKKTLFNKVLNKVKFEITESVKHLL